MKSEMFPLSAAAKVHHNTREAELIEEAIRRGEARFAATGSAGGGDRRAYRAAPCRTSSPFAMPPPRRPSGGTTTSRCRPSSSSCCGPTSARTPSRASCSCRTSTPAPIPRIGSMPASSPSTPGTRCSSATCCAGRRPAELAGFKPRVHGHQPAELQGRPQTLRRAQRDRHRLQLRQAAGADRRHVLRRRDQEIGVHLSQLRHARQGRDAHALLGQRRPQGRLGDLLRPVGHRQDDAVGRSQAHAAGRRRARLVGGRHLQFRGRLLRQDHPPVARRPSPRSGPPPTASAPCWRTSSSIRRRACPTSTTAG